jgi:hypothetical protein
MRVLELALAGVLAVTVPIAEQANGPASNVRPVNTGPAPTIMLAWDGGASGRQARSIDHPTAGHVHQWNGGWVAPHWLANPRGWGPYGRQHVPTYWVWGPSGGAFDYPDLLGQWP